MIDGYYHNKLTFRFGISIFLILVNWGSVIVGIIGRIFAFKNRQFLTYEDIDTKTTFLNTLIITNGIVATSVQIWKDLSHMLMCTSIF